MRATKGYAKRERVPAFRSFSTGLEETENIFYLSDQYWHSLDKFIHQIFSSFLRRNSEIEFDVNYFEDKGNKWGVKGFKFQERSSSEDNLVHIWPHCAN